jgi:hypothetical protein
MRTGGDSSDGVRNLVLVCVLPIVGGLAIITTCYFLLFRRRPCEKNEFKACEVKDTKQPADGRERGIPAVGSDGQSKKKEPVHIKTQSTSPLEGCSPDKVHAAIAKLGTKASRREGLTHPRQEGPAVCRAVFRGRLRHFFMLHDRTMLPQLDALTVRERDPRPRSRMPSPNRRSPRAPLSLRLRLRAFPSSARSIGSASQHRRHRAAETRHPPPPAPSAATMRGRREETCSR